MASTMRNNHTLHFIRGVGTKKYKLHHWIIVFFTYLCLEVSGETVHPPQFLNEPSSSGDLVNEGQSKILQCQATGVPPAEYTWMKDGDLITNRSSDTFYGLKQAKRDDAGDYRCIAMNPAGALLSDKLQLHVAYMNISEKENETISIRPGESVTLLASGVKSHPKPIVKWINEKGQIVRDTKFVTLVDDRMVLAVDEPSHGAGGRDRVVFVQVIGDEVRGAKPVIVVAPDDVEVLKDTKSVQLHCVGNFRSFDDLTTTWKKDGVPLDLTNVPYSIADSWNRTLTLTNLDELHEGLYECQVSIDDASVRATANVTVSLKPYFEVFPKEETKADYGSSVLLPCKAGGRPKPSIKWFLNAEPIAAMDDRLSLQEDCALVINNLRMNDTGIYQCFAENSAGEIAASTWLKIKTAAPIIREGPKDLTVYDGKDAQLPCIATGSPLPKVTWWLNGSTEIKSAGRVQILNNGGLLIAAVQPIDSGHYTCVQSNTLGSVNVSAQLSVLVKTQIVQPPVDTKVILGHKATLLCRVSHDPLVSFELRWYFDGKELKGSKEDRIKIRNDGTLEIQEARNVDIGTYMCEVESPGGDDTRSAKLDVIELPYQPTTVNADLLANIPKAVNVSWIPGFDGKSAIRNFIVQKRVMRKEDPTPDPLVDWATVLTNVSSDLRYVVLTTLKPAMSYQFRISAVNSVGEGNPSEPSNRVTLPQEPPTAPPVTVVGSARSATSIMIQWQPPPEEDRNGELRGYVIKYNIFGYPEDWKNRTIKNEAQRSYIVDGLITWQLYEIKMAAYNDEGVGVFSDRIRVRTKEGVPLAAPKNVKTEAKNSTTVKIWWKPPNPQMINGVNQGYKVQLWKGVKLVEEARPFKTVLVAPSPVDQEAEQSVEVDELEKYQDYIVTVLCFTSPGDGKRSDPVAVKTMQDVPDAVSAFTFEDVKDKTVHILWSPPVKTNGILLAYTLQYFKKHKPETLLVKNLTADTTDLFVTDLIPSTNYTFEIFGWTEVGPGPSQSSTIQSGVPPVLPHAPVRLSVSKVEAFLAFLQFNPGFDGNTSISKYEVQAQIGRSGTWVSILETPPPDTPMITIKDLIPHMEYRVRLIAHNIVGASPPSEGSRPFQTLQAPPSRPPHSVTVRAMSATALRVRWTPLPQIEWYGIPRGYNISCQMNDNQSRSHFYLLENYNANSYVIADLEEYTEYRVAVIAYNDVGSSPPSVVSIERTRESVPSAGPTNVSAIVTSSTTIVVTWDSVYYGAKSVPRQFKDIPNNATFTTTLTELKKYIMYSIQVSAYTRMGDGVLSSPPAIVTTFADVPGPPSNLFFPDVSQTMARLIWDEPEEPNGEISEYQISVREQATNELLLNTSLRPETRTYRATDLESEKNYLFAITAQTSVGWGRTAQAIVFTTSNREKPEPPSTPQISQSQIQSDQITFTWTPGRDGYAPLRYYTVQVAVILGHWQSVPEKVDPLITAYTVKNLSPFTNYKFRIQATNDIGPSDWSSPTNYTRTLAGAPRDAPDFLNVLPVTTTAVKITWQPLETEAWSGDMSSGGYRIEYHQVSEFITGQSPSKDIYDVSAGEVMLSDLTRDQNYEFVVVAFNNQGEGPRSKPQTAYVGEAVPTGQPVVIEAKASSATDILVVWKPPPENQLNGELMGYKLFYGENHKARESEEIEVVPANVHSYTLMDLKMYTLYNISVLAFNPAGDGPRSLFLEIRTDQGIPSAPRNLHFTEITMNSMRVNWLIPEFPNGQISGYLITYETTLPNEDFSKQRQRINSSSLVVYNLKEEATYTFHVNAITIDSGPDISANVTTGPQVGSPDPLENIVVLTTISAIILQWTNPTNNKKHITGYLIECKKDSDSKWQQITHIDGYPHTEYAISYQNLLPSSTYKFRLFSNNSFGVSSPAETSELVVTPNKMLQEAGLFRKAPFYREVWFLVALAAISIVIIILIIAVLCVKSKTYNYKQTLSNSDELDPVLNGSKETSSKTPSTEKIGSDDGGFELCQSRRNTLRKNTLSRKAARLSNGMGVAKPPPRPSPASITYSDEDDFKGYDDNCDSSSLTEKPSEISSTETEATESEPESEKADPHSHSFVNHYANVNDTLRQSWKRQRPAKGYSSYTDSEPEGSVAVSLNGGHIIMNNMAGSRAPLPGFSSFV
uniref:Protein sidekick n=1 Tax=Strigamia maritima TaxID=126957 RepID=T1JF76_STRMM